jgi:hypothetical protein
MIDQGDAHGPVAPVAFITLLGSKTHPLGTGAQRQQQPAGL